MIGRRSNASSPWRPISTSPPATRSPGAGASIAAAKSCRRAAKRSGYFPATTNPPPRSPPCATQYGLNNFHERHFQVGALAHRRPRLLQPHPVRYPRRIQRSRKLPNACTASPSFTRWSWSATPRPTAPRSTRSAPACTPDPPPSAISSSAPAGAFLLRPHPRSRRRRHRNRPDPRAQRRQKGLFVRIGLKPHDIRRTRTPISAPPRPGPGRAEVSLTPPRRSRN